MIGLRFGPGEDREEASMKSNFLIISVESRKGGVGKTTAALNLARILKERRKHAVLLLDVDITGTNATDCIDSAFWKDSCHAISTGAKREVRVANLLSIFQQQFMPGLNGPRFSKVGQGGDAPGSDSLIYAPDMINVFGSQIYDLKDSSVEAGDKYICKPSILFDELHAFWFIEFLQKTCEAFLDAIREEEPQRPVAVIIDNSPGYVGIAPAVQEWLTDLGPDRGKFLTVASLDKQDFLSCANAIHYIHELYARKWRTSRKFTNAMDQTHSSKKHIELAREDESFFVRLVETQPLGEGPHGASARFCDLNQHALSFYRACNSTRGEIHLSHPERYQGLVINRVPRLVKRGMYTYDTERIYSLMHQKGGDVIQQLLGRDRSSYAHYMVTYDESIEYQFVQPMMSRRRGRLSRRKERFENLLHSIDARRSLPPDELLQAILQHEKGIHPEMFSEIQMHLRHIQEMVEDVIRLVEQFGFSYLTQFIHEEWLPRNILRDFSVAVQNVLLEMEGPFIESSPWEPGDDGIGPEAHMFFEELRHCMNQHLERRDLPIPSSFAEQFLSSLALIVVLSMGCRRWHPKRAPELPDLFGSIAAIEVLHWMRDRKQGPKRLSIQRFLATDYLAEEELAELRGEVPIHPRWLEEGLLPRLYHACTSTQARLIDVRRDAVFLVALIRQLVMEDIREAPVLPYIRGVAEKVIVRKTMSHEAGEEQIAKGFSSVQYMDEFSEVLERVLARWESQE
jgi:hypothetical protein